MVSDDVPGCPSTNMLPTARCVVGSDQTALVYEFLLAAISRLQHCCLQVCDTSRRKHRSNHSMHAQLIFETCSAMDCSIYIFGGRGPMGWHRNPQVINQRIRTLIICLAVNLVSRPVNERYRAQQPVLLSFG